MTPVDVGIVVALAEEFQVLEAETEGRWQAERKAGRIFYRFDRPVPGGEPYRCCAVVIGEMGLTAAANATSDLLHHFEPAIGVLVGIAGSLSNDARLGDVVVARQVEAYAEDAKVLAGADHTIEILRSHKTYPTNSALMNAVVNFRFAHRAAFDQWATEATRALKSAVRPKSWAGLQQAGAVRDRVELLDGPLASGTTVGAAREFAAWLRQLNRRYVALEMEAAGFMMRMHSAGGAAALVVRGISDLSDERKAAMDRLGGGAFRAGAMRNALRFVWRLMDAGEFPRARTLPAPHALPKAPDAGTDEPRIVARFKLTPTGRPQQNGEEEYKLEVFLANAPPEAESVVYQWKHDTIEDQFDEVAVAQDGFRARGELYGDVLIRATIWTGRNGRSITRRLYEALHESHGGSTNPHVRAALKEIEEN